MCVIVGRLIRRTSIKMVVHLRPEPSKIKKRNCSTLLIFREQITKEGRHEKSRGILSYTFENDVVRQPKNASVGKRNETKERIDENKMWSHYVRLFVSNGDDNDNRNDAKIINFYIPSVASYFLVFFLFVFYLTTTTTQRIITKRKKKNKRGTRNE